MRNSSRVTDRFRTPRETCPRTWEPCPTMCVYPLCNASATHVHHMSATDSSFLRVAPSCHKAEQTSVPLPTNKSSPYKGLMGKTAVRGVDHTTRRPSWLPYILNTLRGSAACGNRLTRRPGGARRSEGPTPAAAGLPAVAAVDRFRRSGIMPDRRGTWRRLQ